MKALKNFSFYTFSKILVDAARIILLPIYAAFISIDDYGIYKLLDSFKGFILASLGNISKSSFNRFYFKDRKDKASLPSMLSIFIIGTLLLLILTLIFRGTLISLILGGDETLLYLIFGFIAIAFLEFIFRFYQIKFTLDENGTSYVKISMFYGFMSVALIIFFIVVMGLGITGLMLGLLVPLFLISSIVVWKDRKRIFRIPRRSLMKKYLKFGAPLIGVGLTGRVLSLTDKFALSYFLGAAAVGAYGFIFTLSRFVHELLGGPFYKVVWPKLLKMEDDRERFNKSLNFSLNAILVIISTFMVLIAFFAEYPLRLIIANPDYLAHAYLLYIFAFMITTMVLGQYANKGFYLNNKTHMGMYGVTIAAVFNIVLCIIFIPRYGIVAAAVSTAISKALAVSINIYLSERESSLRYEKRKISAIFILMGVTFSSFYLFNPYVNDIFLKLILSSVYISLLFFTRVMTLDRLKGIFKMIRSA